MARTRDDLSLGVPAPILAWVVLIEAFNVRERERVFTGRLNEEPSGYLLGGGDAHSA